MPAVSLQDATRLLINAPSPLEVEELIIDGRPVRYWKCLPATIPDLLSHCRSHGPTPYLVYEDERLTYDDAFLRVAALAKHLREVCGVKNGDRVALAMRNLPEWVLCFWATMCAGAIVVPLNGWWKANELAFALEDSGSRVLLCDAERSAVLAASLPSLPIEHVLVARGTDTAWPSLDEVLAKTSDGQMPELGITPEDNATIFYTSGTTGRPKGALGTHRNLCANIGSVLFTRARASLRAGKSPLEARSEQAGALLSVPLFHVTGSHSGMVVSSYMGSKIVLMHKWNPERALELIERERLTQFGGVPAMVWQVLESPDFAKRDTSSVQAVSYGGAPAAPELMRRVLEAFPSVSASNGYGLTETSALTAANVGIDYERKPDSIGVAVPVCDVQVVDSEGNPVPTGEVGELWIRGPNVVRGYWQNPEATANSFVDGYLRTGDVARIDDEGFIYVLDRAKDMLIRGGENVYCVEVEDALYSHPAVMDAAVIGIPHRVLGEEVGAVVQLAPSFEVSSEELRQYLAARIAGFKVPVKIEIRHEPLPRNANGKIMKRDLKRELGWV